MILGWAVTWAALIVAYYSPYPIGFYVTTFAFAAYLVAHVFMLFRGRLAVRPWSSWLPVKGEA